MRLSDRRRNFDDEGSMDSDFQINDNQRMENTMQLINMMSGGERHNPVKQNVLDLLPESKLKEVKKLPQDKKSCVICLEDYKENDTILTIPCYHIFHKKCVIDWFKNDNTCPICKFKINKQNLNLK
jgi:hypothetical protein